MNGILLVNKPTDWTSHDVVAKLRKIFATREIGHAGTLDPFATGVLVIAIGQATKVLEYLQAEDKEYIATVELGISSDTYDRTGVISRNANVKAPTQKEIESVLKKFVGDIEQVPPRFSAIKVAGHKSYDRARKGEDFELPAKNVHIEEVEILEYSFPLLKLRVSCGSGTYIRSLAHDIGEKLGTSALLAELERTRVGKFTLDESYTLEDITSKTVLVWDPSILDMATIELSGIQLKDLSQGKYIELDIAKNTTNIFGIFENIPAAILEPKEGKWKTKKLLKSGKI